MATKTLTIMEDAYTILKDYKLDNESFSEEIRRVFSKKKTRKLSDYFGLLSDNEGERMLKNLENIKKTNLKLLKKRINESS